MDGATIGSDCKIGDHSFIESGVVLGDRVTVKNGSLIWHGVTTGEDVFIGPGVVFTNDLTPRVRHQTGPEDWIATEVASGASIGANATILCGIRIGYNSMIGAGSVVTRDVPDHALVIGNPASQRGWVCDCGSALATTLDCPKCGRHYRRVEAGLQEVTP
ncbi:MAG: N-acetyltransferase [Anaerolineae bacterium]|nr:N-acetyltransferase [Anaerolineae bacterium]